MSWRLLLKLMLFLGGMKARVEEDHHQADLEAHHQDRDQEVQEDQVVHHQDKDQDLEDQEDQVVHHQDIKEDHHQDTHNTEAHHQAKDQEDHQVTCLQEPNLVQETYLEMQILSKNDEH